MVPGQSILNELTSTLCIRCKRNKILIHFYHNWPIICNCNVAFHGWYCDWLVTVYRRLCAPNFEVPLNLNLNSIDCITFYNKRNDLISFTTTIRSLLHKYTNTAKCRKIIIGKLPTSSTRVSVYINTSNI